MGGWLEEVIRQEGGNRNSVSFHLGEWIGVGKLALVLFLHLSDLSAFSPISDSRLLLLKPLELMLHIGAQLKGRNS